MQNLQKLIAFVALWASLTLCLFGFSSCKKENVTVKIGVTGAFYEELWAPAVAQLKEENIVVELVQFSDFTLPNNALNSGDINMNAFQHHAYFNNDTSSNNYNLAILTDTFVITMNLYSLKYDDIDDLISAAAENKLTVAVPNDATNFGRALTVLEDAGLLTLSDYQNAPQEENILTSKVELVKLNASMTYNALDDVDAALINGNYAASYGVDPKSAVFYENIDLTNTNFVCLIAVRAEDTLNSTYKRIAEVFCSDLTKQVMDTTFEGFFHIAWEEV